MNHSFNEESPDNEKVAIIFAIGEKKEIKRCLLNKKFIIIDTSCITNDDEGVFCEKLIDMTGYNNNGANNRNVFYELISDIRWFSSDKIAIIIDIGSSPIKLLQKQFVINTILEGAARLNLEQNRRLLTIIV